MKWIRDRVLKREVLSGTFLGLGSGLTAEIAGQSGFDFVVIDLEHGSGDHESLLGQLQGLEGTPAAPIVRIAWNETPRFKRVLDLGVSGVMVPWVNDETEARSAIAAMRYPPDGVRGLAGWTRATRFGADLQAYLEQANNNLVTFLQIETGHALENLDAIAAVEGADVLFVGPSDLSASLGISRQFEHPFMQEAYAKVAAVAWSRGKAAGVLLQNTDSVRIFLERGFTVVAVSSDAAVVTKALRDTAAGFDRIRKTMTGAA